MDISDNLFEGMDDILLSLAQLIGIIGDDKSFNAKWFDEPDSELKDNFTWPHVKTVLEDDLLWGEAHHPLNDQFNEEDSSPVGALVGLQGQSWYNLQGKDSDAPFYFVAQGEEDAGRASLGAGMYKKIEVHKDVEGVDVHAFDVHPFVFVPAFSMPNKNGGGAVFEIQSEGIAEFGVLLELQDNQPSTYTSFLLTVKVDLSTGPEKIPACTLYTKAEGGWTQVTGDMNLKIPEIINPFLAIEDIIDWLKENISDTVEIGWKALLKAIGLIKELDPIEFPFFEIPLITLSFSNWKTWMANLFDKGLHLLLDGKTTVPLLAGTSEKGAAWNMDLIVDHYKLGLGITVKDLEIAQEPLVKLQLGTLTKDGTDWLDQSGRAPFDDHGLLFWVLNIEEGLNFDPQFEAKSVGLDIDRKDKQPLFNVSDYTLKEAQLRSYFSTIKNGSNAYPWGVAAAMNNITLPLGAPAAGNAIASTLMESSDKDKPSVNPEFSFLVAYSDKLYFQLFDRFNVPQKTVDIQVQKSFGPVRVESIAIGAEDISGNPKLLFGLSGGLDLSILELYLEKLTIGIPLETMDDLRTYSLDLEGIGIHMKTSGMALSGGLFKSMAGDEIEYSGSVAIQAAKWSVGAIGAFSNIDGEPSMFVFGSLNAMMGGPAFFVVKGIAAGFGYNRDLILPKPDMVKDYPLVRGALDPTYFTDGNPATALKQMAEFVPPKLGNYWFAAGVKFSSFELMESFALVAVKLGKKSEVSLIGTTTMKLPKQGAPYANVELGLVAVFTPDDGTLQVNGKLTNNSWIIDKDCRLTGEFAFYTWFSGANEGDFVLSIGGYHPDYKRPSHYPAVQPLAMNWEVDSHTTVSGEAYFALTPTMVMAGCKLELNYTDGNLKAWFTAWADFLISWEPFHYDVQIGVTVGASYRMKVLFIKKTFKVELGAKVHIWGPEFAGTARISWWVISFTVPFGAKDNEVPDPTICWHDFRTYFLPAADPVDEDSEAEKVNENIVTINVIDGLIEHIEEEGEVYWVVDPAQLDFTVDTAIPLTSIKLGSQQYFTGNPFSIFPMGTNTLFISGGARKSELVLTVKKNCKAESLSNWTHEADTKNVPYALWGTVLEGEDEDERNKDESRLVKDITMGLTSMRLPDPAPSKGPDAFAISNLKFSKIPKGHQQMFLLLGAVIDTTTLLYADSLVVVSATAMEETVCNKRASIFDFLQDIGSLANQNEELNELTNQTLESFSGSPMLTPILEGSALDISAAFGAQDASFTSTSSSDFTDAPSSISTARYTQKIQSIHNIDYGRELDIPKPYPRPVVNIRKGHALAASTDQFSHPLGGQYITGPTLLSSIAGRWADRKFLLNNASEVITDNGKLHNEVAIKAGTTQFWNLKDTNVSGTNLKVQGNLRLRVAAWDKYGRVVMHRSLSQTDGSATWIPADARRVMLRSIDPSFSYDSFYGWHSTSTLIQSSPRWAIGRGVLIRGEVPIRTKVGRQTCSVGAIAGSTWLRSNVVRGADSERSRGKVSTTFEHITSRVLLFVRADGDAEVLTDAVSVSFSYEDHAGRAMVIPVSVNQLTSIIEGDTVFQVFTPHQCSTIGNVTCEVTTKKGHTLRGVLGTTKNSFPFDAGLIKALQSPEAHRSAETSASASTFTLEYLLNNEI
jgi:hypothetical protein